MWLSIASVQTAEQLPDPDSRDFAWDDGDRLIRFGEGALAETAGLLASRGLESYALLSTERARISAPALVESTQVVLDVPPGPVPDAAAAVREAAQGHPLLALGGGRVIDSAKAIAGADELRVGAIPTTLSGAEMTPFHRMPAGVSQFRLVRPELVIADPSLMASQPMPDLAASAMNALAHAIEALYTPMANPVADEAALRAVRLIAGGLSGAEPSRTDLALGAVYAGYASGLAGFAVHHAVCQTIVRTCGTPHAQTNAVMLPHFVRMMESRALEAMARVAEAAGGSGGTASDSVAKLSSLAGVTTLGELGVERASLDDVIAASLSHPAIGNMPSPPDAEELRSVLEAAL
jgi:maleylacetate reductase